MPFYQSLNPKNSPEDKRIVQNLMSLRIHLEAEIPHKTLNETLLVATWNIREFDKPSFGNRFKESYFYIAEILAPFDIIAVQEVYKDLRGLDAVMKVLGSDWDYIFSDVTEGVQGNNECIAFVYDKRKVRFGGLAGELVIPPDKDNPNPSQFWRTPLICGFTAGWAKFMICSVHILWGKQQGKKAPVERIEEITRLAKFLKKRTEDKAAWARKLILLGDFNIGQRGDETFLPLQEAGFVAPESLRTVYSNVTQDKQYDQILFRELENSLEFMKGGTFDYFKTVFRVEDEPIYTPLIEQKKATAPSTQVEITQEEVTQSEITQEEVPQENANAKKNVDYYKRWRTYQMSDHLPLWVEFRIDFSDEYLDRKLKGEV